MAFAIGWLVRYSQLHWLVSPVRLSCLTGETAAFVLSYVTFARGKIAPVLRSVGQLFFQQPIGVFLEALPVGFESAAQCPQVVVSFGGVVAIVI